MAKILILDAQTKDEGQRITSYGDDITDIARDFQRWVSDNDIKPDDLWYADVFEHVGRKKDAHIASITLDNEGGCIIHQPKTLAKFGYKRKK